MFVEGCIGTWFFTYIHYILRIGKNRPLIENDFPSIYDCDKPDIIMNKTYDKLIPIISSISLSFKSNHFFSINQPTRSSLSLWFILLQIHKNLIIPPAFCKLFGDLCNFIPILCMKYLLQSLDNEELTGNDDLFWNIRKGYIYSFILFIGFIFVSILLHQHHSLVIRAGMLVKYSIINILYKTSMEITSQSKQKIGGSGRLTTLISTDAESVEQALWFGNYLWAAPIQIIITIILLYRELQWSVIGGIFTMILLLFIQAKLGNIQSKIKTKGLQFTDERISILTQILIGIRIWKLNGWEERFSNQVKIYREKELKSIRKIALVSAISSMLVASGPILITLISFVVFSATSNDPLTVSKAFTSLSLFSLLQTPLSIIPSSFVIALNSCAALDRIFEFLKGDKLGKLPIYQIDNKEYSIKIKGDFFWNNSDIFDNNEDNIENDILISDTSWILKDINICLPKNNLTFIIGKVGVGKSTLIHSILGETNTNNGKVKIIGNSIGYCSQTPWIYNDTLQNNILFHSEYNEERYNNVLYACALEDDLKLLPSGDKTEIGEHGVNLSGGQQARISLARAVYANADIYLLDDIFSAVDSNVANHILTNCILGDLLKDKTKIIVTHKLEYINKGDWIIIVGLNNDTSSILFQGSFNDLTKSDININTESDFLQSYKSEDIHDNNNNKLNNNINDTNIINDESVAQLIQDEEHETGSVKITVFFGYLKAFGIILVLVAFFILSIQICTNLLLYWWLSEWATDSYNQDVWFYIQYYSILCCITVICITIFQSIWGIGAYYASKLFHLQLLETIIHAPIQFFNSTPTGRILNRFSHDISITDYKIAKSVSLLGTRFGAMFGVIVLLCILVPYLLLLFIPISIIYIYLQQYYSASSREIRRLDKITKSPIYSYFEETQSGISTVRAYQKENIFQDHMNTLISLNQSIFWTSNQINRWLGLRLEIIGAFTTCIVSFFGVLMSKSLGSGFVGLMISQALTLSSALNWTIRVFVDLESQLTSVERLLYYINNTQEEEPNNITKKYIQPSKEWPNNGKIVFKNVHVRYRDDLPFILNNLNLEIQSQEKIGICGRTGAGKSTLILCLFRIMELSSGCIEIDNIDISTIPLSILRNKLSIIPQSPLLFPGTIRNNLDPFNIYSDIEIWNVLDKVIMKDYISNLQYKLETNIIEWGENFSIGQRQLLCLARAILKGSKIIILDEATASIDPETDQLIQKTIKTEFKNCTIITIAHRITSIIDSDKIIVLDKGSIKEIGKPNDLLEDINSTFYQLLHSAIE